MRKIKTDIEEKRIQESETPTLRPTSLQEYIGQEALKESLRISIDAAKCRKTALDHFLLCGPPGLGKTSLAAVIAKEMDARLHTVSGPVMEKVKDMAAVLATLEENDILFIDEIHRLPKVVEEFLYSAMEDFRIEILLGSMEQTKSVTMTLPRFTLVGATTREGLLSKPFRDRFANQYHFNYYAPEELSVIIQTTAAKYATPFPKNVALQIAAASRGTPRIANSITKRVSDYILARGVKATGGNLEEIFCVLGIDKEGLTETDRKYLFLLSELNEGRPVGLNTIAAYLGETEDTVKESIEPYLVRKGFVLRTRSGRMLNTKKEESKNAASC